MASQLESNKKKAKRITDVIEKFSQADWLKFAKLELGLSDNDIAECQYNYITSGMNEQRYQMALKWTRRGGKLDDLERLAQNPEGDQQPFSSNRVLQGQASGDMQVAPSNNSDLVKNKDKREKVASEITRKKPSAYRRDSNIHPGATGIEHINRQVSQYQQYRDVKCPSPENSFPVVNYCEKVPDNLEVTLSTEAKYKESLGNSNIYQILSPKGLALILNNTFEGSKCIKERKGSRVDVKNMVKLWRSLGCDLYGNETFPEPWKTDKTAEEMKCILEEVSKVQKAYSFVILVIMTHGGIEGENLVIQGTDAQTLKVKEIEAMFSNLTAPHLQDIPKFFIYQICRGNEMNKYVESDSRIPENSQKTFTENDKISKCVYLPHSSDILVAYPTHENELAFRTTVDGSWFINAITNVFMREAAFRHVEEMLTTVHRAMKYKTVNYGAKIAKAMSKHESSLTKTLHLFPGFPQN